MSTPHSVVEVAAAGPGVARVTMNERLHKNAFTTELASSLQITFATIEADESYKVVVLTGHENYFSSGGTQQGLLSIAEGRAKCTDLRLHTLALDCKLPVIAAMQGHALGAGLVLGLLADCVVLSRESVYAANFMRLGFTPGVGSTCVLPSKLGFALAQEMLLSGRSYRGAELAARGVPYVVLPRQEVPAYTVELATDLAQAPRTSLMMLKEHMVRELRIDVAKAIEGELLMHETAFRLPEVKHRIAAHFGE